MPCPATTRLPIAGDTPGNTGKFVRAILAHPEVSLPARYASVQTGTMSHGEILKSWCDVTGHDAQYLECSAEVFNGLFPVWGLELALQMQWNTAIPDWTLPDMLKPEDLGITDLIGWKEALQDFKLKGYWAEGVQV